MYIINWLPGPKYMSNKIQKASLHPNSRKALEQKRMILRAHKLAFQKHEKQSSSVVPYSDRLIWFQIFLDDPSRKDPPSKEMIHAAVKTYINRNDSEIERLKGEVRNNRPIPKKLLEYEELKRKEQEELRVNGIELPSGLFTNDGWKRFKEWNGDVNRKIELMRYRL